MMQTVSFQEVIVQGQKSVRCAGGCKRTLKRSRKFFQTLSPFNKNAAHELKSRDEIMNELLAERRVWLDEPEICSHCKG